MHLNFLKTIPSEINTGDNYITSLQSNYRIATHKFNVITFERFSVVCWGHITSVSVILKTNLVGSKIISEHNATGRQ